jgi:hypothetical protein
MAPEFLALIFGVVGTFLGASIQYFFQRYSAERLQRKEIVESYLLQLQNSLESLYYRVNNLKDWAGKSIMSDDYYRDSTIYILGRILSHESIFITKGIYAKLSYDERLKHEIKRGLHAINWSMGNGKFLHYYRLQIAEMLLEDDRILSYTEFLERIKDKKYQTAIHAGETFVDAISPETMYTIRDNSRRLIQALEARTKVPSALTLLDSARHQAP